MTEQQHNADEPVNPASPPSDSDDTGTDWSNTGSPAGESAEAGGWTSGGRASGSGGAQTWLAQLQAIIDNLATQSAPVVREVGAKAALIAALAAERAGPLAIRAADATAHASVRVAERSRNLAAELRRGGGEAEPGTPGDEDGTASQGPTA